MNFINGKAVIKNGRKTIAKVYDRLVFFKGTRFENSYGKYRYSLEMSVGIKECETMNEVIEAIDKYK